MPHKVSPDPILLRMEGIDKSFPGVHALDVCRFDLRAGEVHALVGENGAGKSTLMKVLTGVYQMDAGAPQKNAIRNGWFVGSITQDPYNIGYLAVELAYKAAMGEEVADVDTGAKWYTAENIDDPDIAILVYD